MRRDRPTDLGVVLHDVESGPRRDVFNGDPQLRNPFDDRQQLPFDEVGLPIEDVEAGVGRLGVHEQRDPCPCHRFEHGAERKQIVAAGDAVGGGPGRVVLGAEDDPAGSTGEQVVDDDLVIEIQHHHRREVGTSVGAGSRQHARSIRDGRLRRRHGRVDVGHHDGVPEHVGRVGGHGAEHLVVAKVDVPVVRCGDLECDGVVGHAPYCSR